MAFVPAKCTQCGANIAVDDSKEAAICSSCGTPFITEKAIQNFNISYNTTNVQNTNYNIEGGEVHIHREYDDAQTLINNLNALLVERGYSRKSEPVQKNFHTMEEKYPADYRTDMARWLVNSDQRALARVREFDREFFNRYIDKIDDLSVLYLLRNEEPKLGEIYRKKYVDKANEEAKACFHVDFTGDMHDVKSAACALISFIEKNKNEDYNSLVNENGYYDFLLKYHKLILPFERALRNLSHGEDVEFMKCLADWFETHYQLYIMKSRSAIQIDNLDSLLSTIFAYKKGGREKVEKLIRDYWNEFFSLKWDAKVQYEYLERTKNQNGAPRYASILQGECFKKGLFGSVTRITNWDEQLNLERVIAESMRYGVN